MARSHPASAVEDRVYGATGSLLAQRHWRRAVLPFVGYGAVDPALEGNDPFDPSPPQTTSTWSKTTPKRRVPEGGFAHVLGRVVLTRTGQPQVPVCSDDAPTRRGFRAFFSVPQAFAEVRVRLGDADVVGRADRGGYFDIAVSGHGLRHGWHEAHIECGDATVSAPVQIIGGHVQFGIISDIDDTVLVTALPRLMIAAWNTFVVEETARREVPGMAAFYRQLLAGHPDAAMFYLSTGAWNTQPILTRFLRRCGYPRGTLLLTDWGPTETSWFRSGRDHKRRWLRRLAHDFPHIKWQLVGDDGQHDPALYEEFAVSYPEHVAGIAIRQLTPAQQVLSHGHPLHMDFGVSRVPGVPWIEGPNGFALHRVMKERGPDEVVMKESDA